MEGNNTSTYRELEIERGDLLAECWTGEFCGKNLENYHNRCRDIQTGTRCWLAQLLDENKLKMESYSYNRK